MVIGLLTLLGYIVVVNLWSVYLVKGLNRIIIPVAWPPYLPCKMSFIYRAGSGLVSSRISSGGTVWMFHEVVLNLGLR